MTYTVEFTPKAVKQLKKLDKATAAMIVGWVRKNLDGCDNPRQHGKNLTANKAGQWRYRVGDYRIISHIQDDKVLILVLEVGHRREIYG